MALNWVVKIKTAMEDCPSAEELEKIAKANNLSPVDVWKRMMADGKLQGNLP